MKKILIILALLFSSVFAWAGEVKYQPATVKTEQVDGKSHNTTNYVYTDKDGSYRIYRGSKGGLYYFKVAKSGKNAGKLDKRYLKADDKAKVKN